ncbi:MAG: enoyl-CoA hydratase-related protein [Dehalococcoidia bacterium]|nr:enoyl-CoA hydratase-related protein [Dehalococcoidia bacterium]
MELKATKYAVEEGIATLTLSRPERLNAWTGRMHTEYRWCLQQAEDDPDVRVIVVTGEGRGFCAGADAAALEGHIEKGGYDPGTPEDLATPGYGVRPEFDQPFAFQFGMRKPIIAAVNGPAAGVGLAIVCFADLRFAARGVKLTTAHGKLGLPAEYGLSWMLPRIVGITHANDMLLSSRAVLAEEAMSMGLLNRLVEPGEVLGRGVRLRAGAHPERFAGLDGRHETADRRGPARRRGQLGCEVGGATAPDDAGGGLQGRRGGVPGETGAEIRGVGVGRSHPRSLWVATAQTDSPEPSSRPHPRSHLPIGRGMIGVTVPIRAP